MPLIISSAQVYYKFTLVSHSNCLFISILETPAIDLHIIDILINKTCIFLQVKVLYARNFQIRTTPETIQAVFEAAINNQIERVKKIYDYAFIHFYQREHAELAMAKLQNVEIDGSNIEIRWAKPVVREIYRIQKMNRGNAKFNNSFNLPQTLLLYKQHLEKKEYISSPTKEDEGIGSGCAGESSCGSSLDMTSTCYPHASKEQYPLAPAKLDSMCKR